MAVSCTIARHGNPVRRGHRGRSDLRRARRARVGRCLVGLALFVAPALLAAAGGGCGPRQHVAAHDLTLRAIAVPANLYAIAGEARAFVADGASGRRGRARLALAALDPLPGALRSARAFSLDAAGDLAQAAEATVTAGGDVELDVVAGTRYVIYPDLSEHSRATYKLFCKLSKIQLPPDLVSRLCQQVLCAGPPLDGRDLARRVPGLADHISPTELGGDLVGGFGPGAGSLCDRCIPQGVIYPDLACREPGPIGPPPHCGDDDRLVFARGDERTTRTAIRVMRGTGADLAGLTAGDATDRDPDVSLHGGHVAFVRSTGATTRLFRVETDGSGLQEVPGTEGATSPSWGRGAEEFIAFVRPVGATAQTAVFRISRGATTPVQVTFPGVGEHDDAPAVVDAKLLVFTRTGAAGRQLFSQSIFNGPPATRLTSLENRGAVSSPVAGHVRDDRLVAFVAEFSTARDPDIRVGRLDEHGDALEILHTIHPGLPVDHRIGRIDLSSNDACVFFDADTRGVPGLPDVRTELYSIDLDGSHLERLTANLVSDSGPSVITP